MPGHVNRPLQDILDAATPFPAHDGDHRILDDTVRRQLHVWFATTAPRIASEDVYVTVDVLETVRERLQEAAALVRNADEGPLLEVLDSGGSAQLDTATVVAELDATAATLDAAIAAVNAVRSSVLTSPQRTHFTPRLEG